MGQELQVNQQQADSPPRGNTFFDKLRSQQLKGDEGQESEQDAKLDLRSRIMLAKGKKEVDTGQQNRAAENEADSKDSRCDDSIMGDQVNGIVGILEGFGLLSQIKNQDSSLSEQGQVTDTLRIDAGQATISQPQDAEMLIIKAQTGQQEKDKNDQGLEINARMPIASLSDEQSTGAYEQTGIKGERDLYSLENTNKGNRQGDAADQMSAGWRKLSAMLESAMSEGNDSIALNTDSQDIQKTKGFDEHTRIGDNQVADAGVVVDQGQLTPADIKMAAERPDQSSVPESSQMEDNLSNIVENITTHSDGNVQEFEITLKPEHLGKLKINLIMDESGIRASIRAADSSVKGLIQEQIPQLQSMLKEKGVNVTNMEVSYDNFTPEKDGQQHNRSWQYMNGTNSTHRAGISDQSGIIPFETMTVLPQMNRSPYSSIEFQA